VYLLRRECGLSARQVVGAFGGDPDRDREIPAWEIDILLEGIERDQKERREREGV
jgi:hypothetical protein